MKKKTLKRIVVVTLAAILSIPTVTAQIEKFQAAFIYNISRYVEWPSSYNADQFIIGVLGNNAPIAGELEVIAKSKKLFGKPIQVDKYASASEIGNCNILFIPEKQMNNIGEAVSGINSKHVLLVTEQKGAISAGSGINFLFISNKLQFELHNGNITQNGLKVNSALESLAIKTY